MVDLTSPSPETVVDLDAHTQFEIISPVPAQEEQRPEATDDDTLTQGKFGFCSFISLFKGEPV